MKLFKTVTANSSECLHAYKLNKRLQAKKVKVYLTNWSQAQRHRGTSVLKNLASQRPLVARSLEGKIINHGYYRSWGPGLYGLVGTKAGSN